MAAERKMAGRVSLRKQKQKDRLRKGAARDAGKKGTKAPEGSAPEPALQGAGKGADKPGGRKKKPYTGRTSGFLKPDAKPLFIRDGEDEDDNPAEEASRTALFGSADAAGELAGYADRYNREYVKKRRKKRGSRLWGRDRGNGGRGFGFEAGSAENPGTQASRGRENFGFQAGREDVPPIASRENAGSGSGRNRALPPAGGRKGNAPYGSRPNAGGAGGAAGYMEKAEKEARKSAQKSQIKKMYARKARDAQAQSAQKAAKGASEFTAGIAKKMEEAFRRHMGIAMAAAVLAALLIGIMSMLSSCTAAFSNGAGSAIAGSFQSSSAEIDSADMEFSKMETELQLRINSIEQDYPGYDEYRYNLDEIGHDPMALICFLSAEHGEFTLAEVQAELDGIFGEMYSLTLEEKTEVREREVENDDGTTGTEEYEVTILEATLKATPLEQIVAGRLSGEAADLYGTYQATKGLLQHFFSPLSLYWYNYVSSYYGSRINPNTGAEEEHKGLDIAVPAGTAVYAAQDGTISETGYDSYWGYYVVITDDKGYASKYAHLQNVSVSQGDAAAHGDKIAETGSTGTCSVPHLHIECLKDGEYYNPLFYFEAGAETLYGEGTEGASLPDAYGDAQIQALADEIARYIGMPYVWGGSDPSTGFDCSGFVCYVYTNSGTYDLARTTAQGIYDQCASIRTGEAQPGDLVFFTGTYNSGTAVSHVGIYLGNGIMAHAGDPIKYSSINTSYWQSHLYGYGRLY